MANIDKLTRMQQVKWPEFSWEMVPGNPSTRTFTTFATYISRLGYDNEGRVWSIICPQMGFGTAVGDMNTEVTVTGELDCYHYAFMFFCRFHQDSAQTQSHTFII